MSPDDFSAQARQGQRSLRSLGSLCLPNAFSELEKPKRRSRVIEEDLLRRITVAEGHFRIFSNDKQMAGDGDATAALRQHYGCIPATGLYKVSVRSL